MIKQPDLLWEGIYGIRTCASKMDAFAPEIQETSPLTSSKEQCG
jgi:hypothetical protein